LGTDGEPPAVLEAPGRHGRIRKPRIQGLRVALKRNVYKGIVSPTRNDDVFHSNVTVGPLLTNVVMEVAHVNEEDAEELLTKVNGSVPSVSYRRGPTQKLLKPWLEKTRNNVHFSLKTVITRAWAVDSRYKIGATEPTRMQYFLKGRGCLRAPAGRRGVVNAFLAMMAYCGVDQDEKMYSDGRDGDTLISTWISEQSQHCRSITTCLNYW